MAIMTIKDTIDVHDDAKGKDVALACEELLGDMGYLRNLPLLESLTLFVALSRHVTDIVNCDPEYFLDKVTRLTDS